CLARSSNRIGCLTAATALLAADIAARGAAGVAARSAAGHLLDDGDGHHTAAGDGLLTRHALGHHAGALVGHALGNHDRVALRDLLRYALAAAHLGGDLLGHHLADGDLHLAGHTLAAAHHLGAGRLDPHLVGAPHADGLHRLAA